MIIEDKKIIFCHIDKTGGSSISKNLNHNINIHSLNEPVQHHLKHQPMKELMKLVNNPAEYFKFAFVRNPYDRAVSKYFHHRKVDGGTKLEKQAKILEFNEWVKKGGLHVFRPQFMYIYDGDINLCDFIGRFENLNHDYNILKNRFNLDELVHINHNYVKPTNKSFMDYYDSLTCNIVNHLYGKDFELFGYKKIV